PRRQVEMAERVMREGLSAEEIREASRQFLPLRGTRATRPAPEVRLDAGSFAPAGGEASAADGPVVRTLQECARAVGEIGAWLEERRWTPSRVSNNQRRALEQLGDRVSVLEQQL